MDGGDRGMDERGLEAVDLSEGRGIIRGRKGRPPTKVTLVPRRLSVFAEIVYIPLEGRVDSRAARQSVRALQPRQVVVLGGAKNESSPSSDAQEVVDEVKLLAEAAQSFATGQKEVFTPFDQDTVELEVGHAAYSVRLIDNPYRTREEKEQEEEPPEPIESYEAKLGACTASLLDYVATGQKVALDGSIVLAPRLSSSRPPSIYLSDGEVLLTDLRSELIAQGMKAEYRYVELISRSECLVVTRNEMSHSYAYSYFISLCSAHAGYTQLVVNGKVVVRKDQDSGRIYLEGPLCEDFFAVRSVVCGQYVTL